MNDHKALIRAGNVPADEWVGGIDRWDPLEIDIGAAELRTDVIDVVRHPAQDGVHNRLGGIAALSIVAVDLLDPFEVGDRHHTDKKKEKK